MRGTYEYSDFPMDDSFGVKDGEHIPGDVVQRYLQSYAEHFGVLGFVRCHSRVETIQHVEEGNGEGDFKWKVTYVNTSEGGSEGEEVKVHARKLILATGITSQPYLPHINGQESFDRPLFHTVDMPRHHESVLRNPENRIVVLGGTKSAWDAVYTAATAGARVDWIIRDNGHGPCWMAPPYVTPLHKWLEKLVTTRFLTWFSPCIWADPGAEGAGAKMRSFLHGTWMGRKIVDGFWSVLGNDVVSLNKFDSHPELKKLQPWISPFWVASGLSILNYPTNFFDLVTEGKVRIHIDHIETLGEGGTIHLANSSEPLTDISALVCATGWTPTPSIKFSPSTLPSQLGFPNAPDPLPSSLVSAADNEILSRFPRLKDRPSHDSPSTYEPLAADAQTESQSLHPYRLTRFMVPASTNLARERSIAFMGVAMTINTPLLAQTQALWISAFFSGKLSLNDITREKCPKDLIPLLQKISAISSFSSPNAAEVQAEDQAESEANTLYETALHTQFGIYRYPGGLGRRNPDFVFDAIPYVDVLLRDLGLRGARKEGKGLGAYFEPYGVEDYRGFVGEWIGMEKKNELGDEKKEV
ncbi:flavin-binding monooxygenase-like protein [Aspergillus undulatus]|uniref:flavin-binding monooxygenase-like protein n=1 Tax=Aspergillus undulatus TaxID=1810928 RepID=UPI003CCD57FF